MIVLDELAFPPKSRSIMLRSSWIHSCLKITQKGNKIKEPINLNPAVSPKDKIGARIATEVAQSVILQTP